MNTEEVWTAFVFVAVLGVVAMLAGTSPVSELGAHETDGALCLRYQRLGYVAHSPTCVPFFPSYTLQHCSNLPVSLCPRGARVSEGVLHFGACKIRGAQCVSAPAI